MSFAEIFSYIPADGQPEDVAAGLPLPLLILEVPFLADAIYDSKGTIGRGGGVSP